MRDYPTVTVGESIGLTNYGGPRLVSPESPFSIMTGGEMTCMVKF